MKLKTDNDQKQVEHTRLARMTKFFLSVSLVYRDHPRETSQAGEIPVSIAGFAQD